MGVRATAELGYAKGWSKSVFLCRDHSFYIDLGSSRSRVQSWCPAQWKW